MTIQADTKSGVFDRIPRMKKKKYGKNEWKEMGIKKQKKRNEE